VRVFIDTNVLFSGLHSSGGNPSRVLEAAFERRITAIVSVDVLRELIRNVRNKAPHLAPAIGEFLVAASVEFAGGPAPDEILRWYNAGFGSDAPIVAAALATDVEYLCTGDRGLLRRAGGGALVNVRAVSPAGLVRLLAELP